MRFDRSFWVEVDCSDIKQLGVKIDGRLQRVENDIAVYPLHVKEHINLGVVFGEGLEREELLNNKSAGREK